MLYKGTDLLKLTEKSTASSWYRDRHVYQDSLSALNPSMLISAQMKQLTSRGGYPYRRELLTWSALTPSVPSRATRTSCPVASASASSSPWALTRDPSLVICDEPTTALDVTVQKQVIKLLNDLQKKLGFAMIFVSHDLALVAELPPRSPLCTPARSFESAPTKELLTTRSTSTRRPAGLVLSIEAHDGKRLHQVPGFSVRARGLPQGRPASRRASSHPTVGLDVKPVMKLVAGTTDHWVSELPDDVLAANGITSRARDTTSGCGRRRVRNRGREAGPGHHHHPGSDADGDGRARVSGRGT